MRVAALVVTAVVLVAGCGDGDGATEPGGLPACAAALPLPDGLEVAEVTATPRPDNPTCAVVLAADEPIDDVVASVRAALDAAGVQHVVRHVPARHAVLRLDGPVCGSVVVFAAGTERITDAVPPDRTPALASITDCPGARPPLVDS